MLLIFGIMFLLFTKVFVPRIGGTISQREDRIAGDIGDARRLKAEAEAQAAGAAEEMQKARADGQKVVLDAKARVQADATAKAKLEEAKLAETLAKAEARIIAMRDSALTHVRDIASETAVAIVQKLTDKTATPEEVEQALAGQA